MKMRCAAVLFGWVVALHPLTCVEADVSSELVERLTERLQQFYDAEDYGERLQLLSKRAQLNSLSAKLLGLIRRGHTAEVAKTLERFDVQRREVPPLATTEMSTQELVKLRVGQWLYTQQLAEELGNRQAQFLDELQRIQPFQPNIKVALKSVKINSDQDRITAQLVVSGRPSRRIRFVLSGDEWLYDGTDSPLYFSLQPAGILKEGDAKLSPVIIRDLLQQGKTDEAIALLDEALAAEPENPRWIGLNSNLVGYLARDNPDLAKQRSIDQYQALMKRDGLDLNSLIALAEAVEFLVTHGNASLEEKLAIIDAGRDKVRIDPDRAYIPLRSLDTLRYRVLLRAGKDEDATRVMEDLLANYRQRLSGIEIGPLTAFVGVVKTYTSAMQQDFPELAERAYEEAVQVVESALNDEAATVGHFGLLYDLRTMAIGRTMRTDPATARIWLDQLQQKCDALRAKLDPSEARGLSRYETNISRIRNQADGKL